MKRLVRVGPQGLLAAASLALAVSVVLAHGCLDDRAQVARSLFACNPASTTADRDCGAGYLCYGAAQAVGGAFCVPRCDPKDPKTCVGYCTQGGECLQRCTVEAMSPQCPPSQRCIRSTDSPLDVATGQPDGVCLVVNSSCARDEDCNGSSIFTSCISTFIDQNYATNVVPSSGSICAQTGCHARQTACVPGSSCVQNILSQQSGAPDACSPDCVARDLPSGQRVFECLPGFECLPTAFPQNAQPRTCLPGVPGWLCNDSLECSQGHCDAWSDVAKLEGLKTCSPPCTRDDDCIPFEQGRNPSPIGHLTCHAGHCRSAQSFFFPMSCLVQGATCALDPQATCIDPAALTDGGAGAPLGDQCNPQPSSGIGGATAVCLRFCTADAECNTLQQNAHVPFRCDSSGVCLPSTPLAPCKSKETCVGDLDCLPNGPGKRCTRACTSDPDCENDPALGTSFFCGVPAQRICLPRDLSGCAPTTRNSCLSRIFDPARGICVSPPTWPCDSGSQCMSGTCDCHVQQSGTCVAGRCR